MQQSVCILKVAGAFTRFRRAWRNVIIGGILAIAANGGRADDLPFTAVWSNIPDLVTSTNVLYNYYAGCDFKGKLADGRLLFVAAKPGDSGYRILLFDPQSNSWQWKAQLPADSYTGPDAYRVFPLSDGRCLVAKEGYARLPQPAYIYDPVTDVLTRKADQITLESGNLFQNFTYAELPNQEVYLFGCDNVYGPTFKGEIYNLTNNTWRLGPDGPPEYNTRPDANHSRVRWPDGSVTVLCSGFQNYSKVRTLTFDPVQMAFVEGEGETPLLSGGRDAINSCIRGSSAYYSFTTPYSVQSSLPPYDYIRNTNGMNRIYSVDRSTGKLLLLHTRAPAGYMSFFFAAGRDWMCRAYSDSALCGGEAYDIQTSQWMSLPQGPANPIYVPDVTYGFYFREAITLSDGFLLVGRTGLRGGPDAGILRAVRLRVSSAAVPPQVSPLPASLTMDEGTSTNLAYGVIGDDFPAGGVDVVVERLSGDGDVRVVDGATQRVMASGERKTVRIVALTDADAANEQAVIRVRMVQPGNAADPNARTIPVTVRDLYHDEPPVIVSAAWADPNPVRLPAGTTVHVVAGDADGDPLSYAWSKVSGSGTATFATPSAADSGVIFSAGGTYVLRVTVEDGKGGSVTSDVSVGVTGGSGVDPRADVNADGVVNVLDLQIVIANFGKTVP